MGDVSGEGEGVCREESVGGIGLINHGIFRFPFISGSLTVLAARDHR